MTALTPAAKEQIRDAGLTVAAYVRAQRWRDDGWWGDSCGCPDDRCRGYHHDDHEECRCLLEVIEHVLTEQGGAT